MDADTPVVKQKHERHPMTQEQKRRTENSETWTRRRKKHWTPTGCEPRD